jgi:hypothetical protein
MVALLMSLPLMWREIQIFIFGVLAGVQLSILLVKVWW